MMNTANNNFHNIAIRLFRKWETDTPRQGRVVLVSSARRGEGKSHVSVHLGRALASMSNDPVLLLDAAVSRPVVHEVFGCPNEGGGFVDCLKAGTVADSIRPYQEQSTGLHVLHHGKGSKPGLLFQREAVSSVLENLRARYGIVVVDGEPLETCGSLAQVCDGIVLVVDSSSTRREVVQGMMEKIGVPRQRYYGAVLNKQIHYIPPFFYRGL